MTPEDPAARGVRERAARRAKRIKRTAELVAEYVAKGLDEGEAQRRAEYDERRAAYRAVTNAAKGR